VLPTTVAIRWAAPYRGRMTSTHTPLLVDPLVSTQWLADHLGSERLIVLDASVVELPPVDGGEVRLVSGYDLYLFDGHVPGAVFAELLDPHQGFGASSPDEVRRSAAAVGVGEQHTLVVYDQLDGRSAERLRAALTGAGYERVARLEGGLRRWRSEARELRFGGLDGSFGG
jgi:3-mercaptopyruvate sulfurtransferase SseA